MCYPGFLGGDPDPVLLHDLFELRMMVASEAAALAAEWRSTEHLIEMEKRSMEWRVIRLRSNWGAPPTKIS